MDDATKRRVALMQRYSAIPFEKIMFINRMNDKLKEQKNNERRISNER